MPRLSVIEGRKKEICVNKESRREKKHDLWLKTFFRLLPEAEKSKDNQQQSQDRERDQLVFKPVRFHGLHPYRYVAHLRLTPRRIRGSR